MSSCERPPLYRVWLSATRPHTLTASVSPCVVGYALAKVHYPDHECVEGIALAWLGFCMLIQLGTNLHNDYADCVLGADTEERVGFPRATQKGWLTPFETATASTVCVLLAFLLSITTLLPEGRKDYFAFIIATSIINTFAYTGGPYPIGHILGNDRISIAYYGLGDLFVFIYFGVVATTTIPYLITLQQEEEDISLTWYKVFLSSVPMGFLSMAILVVNNIRDHESDELAHKRTLVVRFGIRAGRLEYTLLLGSSYAVSLLLERIWLPCLSLPVAFHCWYHVAYHPLRGKALNAFLGKTAMLQLLYAILYAISLLSYQ